MQNVRKSTRLPLIAEHVKPDMTVFTDEHAAYNDLPKRGYQHHRVNRSAKVYVHGNVHTNTIEGFWSLLKNGIRGVNHSVGAGHLQSYVNAYAFRYGRYGAYSPLGE